MDRMIFLCVAIVTVVLSGVVLTIAAETAARSGKWGLNMNSIWDIIAGKGMMRKVSCPRCGREQGPAGKSAGPGELLKDGWTCPHCGADMDKWGKPRT
jgi:transposase-like protein